jgi:hypothetical protein
MPKHDFLSPRQTGRADFPRAGAGRSSAIWENTARNQGNWSMLIWDE